MPDERSVTSWGRLSHQPHHVVALRERTGIDLSRSDGSTLGLPYGNGRSYGDVCLNPGGTLWLTRGLDRFIAFDRETGVIECEAGVLLKDIIDVALPHGFFVPVAPGTQFATLGGAIANDVHGKNHHRAGTFGEHVQSLSLQRTDGTLLECGPAAGSDWFDATIGGMGLTGLIRSASLRLKRVPGPWLDTETLTFDRLDEFFALSDASVADWEYTVAWIDCRGERGVFFRGNHAGNAAPSPRPRTRAMPVTPPLSLVNSASLRLFNSLYFHAHQARRGRRLKHYIPFFFPLDNILEWNRMYGPRGFYQYQCVVPRSAEREATRELLAAIARSNTGSFLAVLKAFGDRTSRGLLSFPMPGTTLALDFPNLGTPTLALFERLNAIVLAAGGRLYPAKDACMTRELFVRGYPRLAEFMRFRDPGISSAMARRLIDA